VSLDTTQVSTVMHEGVLDCAPQTPLAEVAALMAARRVHCVVVDGLARAEHGGERLVWGLVSDRELMEAASESRLDASAGDVAAGEVVTVEPSDTAREAARLMAEHDCSHLIVADPQTGRPLGVVSSLDVARAAAAG